MLKVFRYLVVASLSVVLFGCGGGGTSNSDTNKTDSLTIAHTTTVIEDEFLKAINDARATDQDCHTMGLFSATTALKWNENLYKAAYEHSYDMAKSDTFSHTGSNTSSDITAKKLNLGGGSNPGDRILYNGYSNFSLAGENIVAGTTCDTAQKAVAEWLKSDHHCANMMNPNYTDVGLARYEDTGSYYTNYWTQDFGKK